MISIADDRDLRRSALDRRRVCRSSVSVSAPNNRHEATASECPFGTMSDQSKNGAELKRRTLKAASHLRLAQK
jgi:hypothetical protein